MKSLVNILIVLSRQDTVRKHLIFEHFMQIWDIRKYHSNSTVTLYGVVGFEVITAVVMKISIFWDITPCSPLRANRRFGGTYRQCLLGTCFHAGFLLTSFFRPWRWRRYVPPKRRLTLIGPHGVISQKMVLFTLRGWLHIISNSRDLREGKRIHRSNPWH
jgi:hypothetical protein